MRKPVIIGLAALIGVVTQPALAQAQMHSHALAPDPPMACFFLEGSDHGRYSEPNGPKEERDYDSSVAAVYRLWCTADKGDIEARTRAANLMVARWRAVWERGTPFNAAFHEEGAFDLLVLLGITQQMPEVMARDPKFLHAWLADCSYTCFHLGGDPADPAQGKSILMQLRLRNDVLDNLKEEPAAEPVIKMLADAKFTLVD